LSGESCVKRVSDTPEPRHQAKSKSSVSSTPVGNRALHSSECATNAFVPTTIRSWRSNCAVSGVGREGYEIRSLVRHKPLIFNTFHHLRSNLSTDGGTLYQPAITSTAVERLVCDASIREMNDEIYRPTANRIGDGAARSDSRTARLEVSFGLARVGLSFVVDGAIGGRSVANRLTIGPHAHHVTTGRGAERPGVVSAGCPIAIATATS
jgi:hypothetical protein